MTDTYTNDQVGDIIRQSIAEALLVPVQQVVPAARMISDLKAESIDIADVRFRIEDALGIRIDQRRMIEDLGSDLPAEEFDNRFTVQFIIDYTNNQRTGDKK